MLATTTFSVVKVSYMRRLTSKWNGIVGTQFSDNQSFTTNQSQLPNRSYKYWNSQVEASRRFSTAWNLLLRYAYIHDSTTNISTIGTKSYSNNALQATINYTWNHPLGR